MSEGQMRDNTSKKIKFARKLRKNQTPQEVILWSQLRNRKFNNLKFRRQHSIGKYIVDFVCLEKKLVIELDGWQHREDKCQTHDEKRNNFLKEKGFETLRFWNNEINNNLEGVLLKIGEKTY